jgi:small subunit ribosomal protein S9
MVERKTVKKTSSAGKKAAVIGNGTGRRKTAVARVWLRKGSGNVLVNGRNVSEYFDTEVALLEASLPFKATPVSSNYDFEANVQGGGLLGQAGAVKLGIARALVQVDETLRQVLRQFDLLTVDSRTKERKKYGQKAARRKFQFVKR